MAKKKRFQNWTPQQIEAYKAERRASILPAIFFLAVMTVGIMLATSDGCADTEEPVTPSSSDTVIADTTSGSDALFEEEQ